ncbi:DUF3846 domain-containing protein [Kineococcus sp. R86509]|uniref:DUF3846 domain-containing protein n=1 Tax=Kineococcus sp. R86509 TaxID=3093851 RepID=UPI0036D35480
MPKVLVIPVDVTEPIRIETLTNWEAYQSLVGGWIESAPVDRDDLSLFINEEGKVMNLPRNSRADDLWRNLLPSGRIPGDYIAGTAVVVGFDATTGADADVPDSIVADLLPQTGLPTLGEPVPTT